MRNSLSSWMTSVAAPLQQAYARKTDKKSDQGIHSKSEKITKCCLKLKILITIEAIKFSILGKIHIGPVMVLDYFFYI